MGVVSHMILGGREIVKTTYMCSRDNNFQTSAICPLKCMLQSQFISCATGSKEYYYSRRLFSSSKKKLYTLSHRIRRHMHEVL